MDILYQNPWYWVLCLWCSTFFTFLYLKIWTSGQYKNKITIMFNRSIFALLLSVKKRDEMPRDFWESWNSLRLNRRRNSPAMFNKGIRLIYREQRTTPGLGQILSMKRRLADLMSDVTEYSHSLDLQKKKKKKKNSCSV